MDRLGRLSKWCGKLLFNFLGWIPWLIGTVKSQKPVTFLEFICSENAGKKVRRTENSSHLLVTVKIAVGPLKADQNDFKRVVLLSIVKHQIKLSISRSTF